MITLLQYVGPHKQSPDWTPQCEVDATRLLSACCALEAEMARGGVTFPDNPKTKSGVSGTTFGGFRPQDCPEGAPNSSHKKGQGVDRYDPFEKIDNWCLAHPDRLAFHGIFIEHPSKTVGWSHWTTRSPPSGNRIFYP